jgi:DNA primase catalytic subunit
VADEAAAREVIDQIVKQTAQFGLPPLEISFSGNRGIVVLGD